MCDHFATASAGPFVLCNAHRAAFLTNVSDSPVRRFSAECDLAGDNLYCGHHRIETGVVDNNNHYGIELATSTANIGDKTRPENLRFRAAHAARTKVLSSMLKESAESEQ